MRTNGWIISFRGLLCRKFGIFAILKWSSRWKNNFKWKCWLVDRYVREEKEQPGFARSVASRTYGLIIASSGARCRRGHLVRASTPWQTLPIFFLFSPPHFLISPSRFMPMFRWRKSGAINNRTLISPWLHVPQLSLTYVKKKEERKERTLDSTRTNTKYAFKEKKLNEL